MLVYKACIWPTLVVGFAFDFTLIARHDLQRFVGLRDFSLEMKWESSNSRKHAVHRLWPGGGGGSFDTFSFFLKCQVFFFVGLHAGSRGRFAGVWNDAGMFTKAQQRMVVVAEMA